MPVYVYYYFLFLAEVHEKRYDQSPPSLVSAPIRRIFQWGRGRVREDRKVILDDDLRALVRFLKKGSCNE